MHKHKLELLIENKFKISNTI
uniref:Uncharacterized protein n=1 Tax=Anguilla anguilla TaxID=7936 RepID=A0A0E9UII4_ANGAN